MIIVNIAPNTPYNDYWGYQDNLLPKYQLKLGHKVTMITTIQTHKDGGIAEITPCEYTLKDGQHVIRLKYKQYPLSLLTKLFSKLEIYDVLKSIHPDFIFYHGLLSSTILDVIRYVKKDNPACVVVEDNHWDYNIGSKSKGLKKLLGRSYFRLINRISIPYVSRVYGVTPWRKTYAEDYFRIPADKTDVLIMGADDEKIDFQNRGLIRAEIRKQYGFSDDDFVIVTGGKIDSKKKTTFLMKACMNMSSVKLLVFGNVNNDIKEEFDDILTRSDNITSIGWIDSDKVYDYFFAADLVFFPGQHSVLWEQACACKVPCVFERWEGMEHVNNGGNSDFVSPVTVDTLKEKITELLFTDKYYKMKQAAASEKTDIYLYSKIAEKSLECAKGTVKC